MSKRDPTLLKIRYKTIPSIPFFMSGSSPNLLSTISKTFCISAPHCLILLQRSPCSHYIPAGLLHQSPVWGPVKPWTVSSTCRTLLPGFLTRTELWQHITSNFIHFHWLPMRCIHYKLLLLTYLSLHALKFPLPCWCSPLHPSELFHLQHP